MYELARELGLSNKETVDLCNDLGIGVKSHSSSVVEAQADRVRRKAEREGLIREPAPEPEEEKKEEAPPKKPVSSKKAPPKKAAPTTAAAPEATPAPAADAPATPEPPAAAPKAP
ncbi:MAG: translation initiation factor IF-2, partial [Acidimicrobiales bacterium]|nr:translation initiation factor IF-2 [Acidimicrobiales bacterium]